MSSDVILMSKLQQITLACLLGDVIVGVYWVTMKDNEFSERVNSIIVCTTCEYTTLKYFIRCIIFLISSISSHVLS